jgi:D-alanine-D-alanine ligase
MQIQTVGIVLETEKDARNEGTDLEAVYHWREPEEIIAIVNAIESLGFRVIQLGSPRDLWRRLADSMEKIDFIFNLSVGFRQRFRLALGPSLYELIGIPYSGADPYTKMVSQNKHVFKAFLEKLGLPTPAWIYLHDDEDLERKIMMEPPFIVKPAYEGSSIGIDAASLVWSEEELRARARYIFQKLKIPVIAEQFIIGREFKVCVIGNELIEFIGVIEDLRTDGSPMGELFLNFSDKSRGLFAKAKRSTQSLEIAGVVEDCLKIYRLFIPMDYGTFDIRLDDRGGYYFLEFNADATLHPRRTLAQCCALNGMEFNEMIEKILTVSFKRWDLKWS